MGGCFSIFISRKKPLSSEKKVRRKLSLQRWRTVFLAIRISCRFLQTSGTPRNSVQYESIESKLEIEKSFSPPIKKIERKNFLQKKFQNVLSNENPGTLSPPPIPLTKTEIEAISTNEKSFNQLPSMLNKLRKQVSVIRSFQVQPVVSMDMVAVSDEIRQKIGDTHVKTQTEADEWQETIESAIQSKLSFRINSGDLIYARFDKLPEYTITRKKNQSVGHNLIKSKRRSDMSALQAFRERKKKSNSNSNWNSIDDDFETNVQNVNAPIIIVSSYN